MDNRSEAREFLTTRRAKVTPAQAGLPDYSGHRRVPGLRREEVALLAGVSVDYYTRLERGNLAGASDAVLSALARALQLDDAETAHLIDLARSANPSPIARRRRTSSDSVRPGLHRVLDAITDAPAVITTARSDYLAGNALGRALYAPIFAMPRPNGARFSFLDPAAPEFYPEWERVTQEVVANLRAEAGRSPTDRRLVELVGELSMSSERFRTLWAAHDVRHHRTGSKRLNHPVVGELALDYEAMELSADPGLKLSVFTAEAGSVSAEALRLLGSWAAESSDDRPTGVRRP
ncbi:helix-turn-helix domain-containing protein [Agromyces sp. NPDC058136]|uniref:helix-turn-helix domain-containing protein n=1 Tax=Agromyces sp. NPDC058136 TaxID=3346354 RepID=UPI0036D8AA3F